MKIKEVLFKNPISFAVNAAALLLAILTLIFYPLALEPKAYIVGVTLLTVFGMIVQIVGMFIDTKGFAPIVASVLYAVAFGIFFASRLEFMGYIQVGITYLNGAFISSMIFFPLTVACAVATAFFKGTVKEVK